MTLQEYSAFLEQIKVDIRQIQLRSLLSITKELILLYWYIRNGLSQKVSVEEWGAKTAKRLVKDLESSFSEVAGFSLFQATLPKSTSNFAQQSLRDLYNFGFLSLDKDFREKELEEELVNQIQKFLLCTSPVTLCSSLGSSKGVT